MGTLAKKSTPNFTILKSAYLPFASKGSSAEEQRFGVHMAVYACLVLEEFDDDFFRAEAAESGAPGPGSSGSNAGGGMEVDNSSNDEEDADSIILGPGEEE